METFWRLEVGDHEPLWIHWVSIARLEADDRSPIHAKVLKLRILNAMSRTCNAKAHPSNTCLIELLTV